MSDILTTAAALRWNWSFAALPYTIWALILEWGCKKIVLSSVVKSDAAVPTA